MTYMKSASSQYRVPVTILSGFLGAGKTTVLNYILNNRSNMKVAVIVNDMSEINIDAAVLERNTTLNRGTDQLIEMSNGCICCTLRADLLEQIDLICSSGSYDYILIESTGISEPMPVAETFAFLNQDGFSLSEIARLDNMITVVNGESFINNLSSRDIFEKEIELETKPLSDLLVDQVEYANVILISHVDCIKDNDLQELLAVLKNLNPSAELIPIKDGEVDLKKVLHTSNFDLPSLANAPGWMKAMSLDSHIESESESYGISSYAYKRRLPFHPKKLANFLHTTWDNGVLLRCKGYFWSAENYLEIGMLVQTGGKMFSEYVGRWWKFIEQKDWPLDIYRRKSILEKWDDMTGDCRQEIVFIGKNIDFKKLEEDLDDCLLTLDEIQQGPNFWASLG
ncbi:GTP-binding protein [Acinetobacter nectaris]|uniref:GTP-binding protein n=1 Tax=Acinetobacter nectaris TaxID=1219382 RepID=UPI001F1BAE5E|nr:GTP-binding protein [Acinetobacter nectaris]